MKVVADTMIWVSYFSDEQSFRHRLLEAAIQRRVRLFVSDYLAEELREILVRDMEISARNGKLAVKKLFRVCRTVELPDVLPNHVPGDDQDNAIVETAVRSKADYLVTADREILKLKKVGHVRIVTAAEFARLLGWSAESDN